MSNFRLHFFKERTRDLNVEAIVAFFEVIEGFDVEIDEESIRFNYTHPRLDYKARFLIMPKSQVRDIYRLSANFLDVNFQLEIPILSPDYFVEHLLSITKRLVERFDLYVYNESFEDVLPYRQELVMKVFNIVKNNYLELNPKFLTTYHLTTKDRLNSILRYMDDHLELQKYYQDSNTYLPYYYLLVNNEGRLRVSIEWQYDTLTVIPPFVEFIFLNRGNEVNIIRYDEFLEQADKFLEDVPGFIKGTKVVSKKNLKKINKILKKNKFSKVLEVFTKIDHSNILD